MIEERPVNDSPQTIRVNLAERSYDIAIGAGNLADAGRFLAERAKVTHVVLITDDNVQKPHAMQVAESIGEQDIDVDVICVEPGEESKSLEMAEGLWQGLLDLDADRKTVVAAVGGGVVGDLAGFIAATFARGLRFLQVPTSLLAQVDSSVGGKVGINLPDGEEHGRRVPPAARRADRHGHAGHAAAGRVSRRPGRSGQVRRDSRRRVVRLSRNQRRRIARSHDQDVLAHVIARCCRLKADVVEQDEREESGLRAVLNFGHTFGHAFETLSWESAVAVGSGREPTTIPIPALHGEAVAIGMVCAARLAERLGRVDAAFTARLRSLLETFGLPVEVPKFDPQQILDSMMHDKKVQHGRLSFVLPSRMGHVELVGDVAEEAILAALEDK